MKKARRIHYGEIGVGLLVLALLGALGFQVYRMQRNFNPALLGAGVAALAAPSAAAAEESPLARLAAAPPVGLVVMSPAEKFDAATLSDKIDGKAELYLASGFDRLECRRFALEQNPAEWLELYLYEMAAPRNAFAVYSAQRRAGAVPLELPATGYAAGNALFFMRGPYYAELVGSSTNAALLAAMAALGRAMCGYLPDAEALPAELNLFPAAGLRAESVTLQISDGFGYERFDQIFMGAYELGGWEATAFISRRPDAAEAAELAEAYHRYLLENGAVRLAAPTNVAGARFADLFGSLELVFSRGPWLAGVHAGEDRMMVERLAAALAEKLKEGAP